MPNSLVTLHGLEQKIKKKKNSHFLVEKHVLVVLLFFLFFYRFTSAPPDFQWINVYIYLKKKYLFWLVALSCTVVHSWSLVLSFQRCVYKSSCNICKCIFWNENYPRHIFDTSLRAEILQW